MNVCEKMTASRQRKKKNDDEERFVWRGEGV